MLGNLIVKPHKDFRARYCRYGHIYTFFRYKGVYLLEKPSITFLVADVHSL